MSTTALPAAANMSNLGHLPLHNYYNYYYQQMMARANEHRSMLQRSQDAEALNHRAHAMLQSVRQVIPTPERPGSVSSPSDSQSSSSSGSSSSSSSHYPKMLHSILSGHADRRDSENASPRSVSSTGSSYGGYNSPSPRSVDSPSPTPAGANKLFHLLKNPSSTSYDADETWERHTPLNLKRKSSEEPMDLSCKKRRSDDEDSNTTNSSSILETLLSGRSARSEWDNDFSSPSSPCPSNTSSEAPSNGPLTSGSDQIVGLAKKVLFPVTARVSDWVVKIISYAQSLPQFATLPCNDRVTLILNSWARLLLLCMAETGFEFAVSPKDNVDTTTNDSEGPARCPRTDELPTMRAVESVQNFIRKCQSLSLDSREYDYLKTITLFNPDASGLEHGEFVDSVFSSARAALQEHLKASKPSDRMRYSHILMLLPPLFSTNSRMMENLFCKHIASNTDMEVLLKEMMKKV